MNNAIVLGSVTLVLGLAGCSSSSAPPPTGFNGSTPEQAAPIPDPSITPDTEQARIARCNDDSNQQNIHSIALEGFALTYPDEQPIPGVHVCIEDRDGSNSRCTDTDAHGKVSMTVTPCHDVRVTYTASGYVGVNQLERIETKSVPVGTHLATIADARNIGSAIGQTFDSSKALPIITTWTKSNRPLAGVTVTMSQPSGTQWYLSATGSATTSLSATSTAGMMGLYNANVGAVEVTASAPGKTCRPSYAVPGATPNSAIVENTAGSMGEAMFVCDDSE